MTDTSVSQDEMRQRPFAYSTVYRHPEVAGLIPDQLQHMSRADIEQHMPLDVARTFKNESNCTVFLPDGTWFTTWGQGVAEVPSRELDQSPPARTDGG